jgi:hypothetical protein
MTAAGSASKAAEARINACLDYARTHAGFTTPGYAPRSLCHSCGLAELQVIDAESTLRLVIFEERPHKFSEKPTYTIETGSMDFNNIDPALFDPALFAPILNAVVSRF